MTSHASVAGLACDQEPGCRTMADHGCPWQEETLGHSWRLIALFGCFLETVAASVARTDGVHPANHIPQALQVLPIGLHP